MHHLVEKAKLFAYEIHKDEMYGEHPYSYHLDNIYSLVSKLSPHIQTVSYLHDVFEFNEYVSKRLEDEFGSYIFNCVLLITDVKAPTRKISKILTNLRFCDISDMYHPVLVAKTADRLTNMYECVINKSFKGLLETYLDEYPAFKNAVYREGLCDDFWKKLDTIYLSYRS
jgi:(p)ppGpp synthase/HD superfamily hydrolase